jgi:hypothetical protein
MVGPIPIATIPKNRKTPSGKCTTLFPEIGGSNPHQNYLKKDRFLLVIFFKQR